MSAELMVDNISWAPGKNHPLLLHPIRFHLPAGQVLGVVGPNGAGKSTLLRMIYRFHRPLTGQVLIGGEDIWSIPSRQAARKVAAVLQEQPTDFALTVNEIVALGRMPHRRVGAVNGAHDAALIAAALDRLDLGRFANRSLGTLSGGERQRVMVARALAQEPQVLVLDEPTNHLDIRHQLEILSLIRDLDLTIVTSLHDLNMAAQVCDAVLMLKNGQPRCFGNPTEVLTETHVSDTFEVHAVQEQLSLSKNPHLSFNLPT